MRVLILVSSIIFSLLFIIAIGKSSLAQPNGNGPNCADYLVPEQNTGKCFGYECRVKNSNDGEGEWELEFFVEGDVLGAIVEFNSDGHERIYGCQCKATGSFNNPKFDTSNWFHCTGPVSPSPVAAGGFFSIEGHVVADGDRIQQGEAVNGIGVSWVLQCDFDEEETCD